MDLVKWTIEESWPSMPFRLHLTLQQILALVIGQRSRIIEEIDGIQNQDEDQDESTVRLKVPSAEALAKITDYCEGPTYTLHEFLVSSSTRK
jgi:hypothetical protein